MKSSGGLTKMGFGVHVIEQVQMQMDAVDRSAETAVKTIVRTGGDAKVRLIKLVVPTVDALDEIHAILHTIFPSRDRSRTRGASFLQRSSLKGQKTETFWKAITSWSGKFDVEDDDDPNITKDITKLFDWRRDLQTMSSQNSSRKSLVKSMVTATPIKKTKKQDESANADDEHGMHDDIDSLTDEVRVEPVLLVDTQAIVSAASVAAANAEAMELNEDEGTRFIREYVSDLVDDPSLTLPAKLTEMSILVVRGELTPTDFANAKAVLLKVVTQR
jgi:hypothetical protein